MTAQSRPFSVVVPTVGRPSLAATLAPLGSACPAPCEVIVVDDRPQPAAPLAVPAFATVVTSGGRGPAAARNVGWRAATAPWVAFLDDDVVPPGDWCAALAADLADAEALSPDGLVAASQGCIHVPLPADRRPTDWERCTAGLEQACWATADMAYRRDVLAEVGGFDERFPRAFREDADLGLRTTDAGYLIVRGARIVDHPVRPADWRASLRGQRGNADDVLMGALHGHGWRTRAGAEPGRNAAHRATIAAGLAALGLAAGGRHRAAAAAAAAWAAATVRFAAARIAPGPRTPAEVATMVVTSAAIPPLATWHTVRGRLALARRLTDVERAPLGQGRPPLAAAGRNRRRPGLLVRPGQADPTWKAEAVLFDRDGTLVVDVPYNGDPTAVALMPGARQAVARARQAGCRVGVVSNQSGIARGLLTRAQVDAVNARVEELLGPFDTWQVCPHGPDDACGCRKPAPGLVLAAAHDLGVTPSACAVIGDIGADVEAARAAGARSVLVPTTTTRRGEVAAALVVAPSLLRAVDFVVAGTC
ncbi:MAG TPA: HAD-IIIA family hydrolase [Acidimicrobiales bacterium]|nr:HAD-IIIA family hydrolase [Acidimicrobiales bacterium]